MTTATERAELEREHDPQWLSRRLRWAVPFAGVWLVILLQPAQDVLDRSTQRWQDVVGIGLLVLFAVLYLALVVIAWDARRTAQARWLGVALLAIGLAVVPFSGPSGLTTLVFVSVAAQLLLPTRGAIVAAVALMLMSVVVIKLAGWSDPGAYVFSILAASLAMFGVVRTVERNRALLAAQRDREQLVVVAERERFARDLHDILGHSLTVITVKSELAGRLVDVDPERARAEIADVERLAREALADVRSTVGNYREVSLTAELASAGAALRAAGVEAQLPGAVDDVQGPLRQLFGYVVREGVTNVVRHAQADRCTITVSATSVEVVDDGRGPASGSVDGHGLAGLRARAAEQGCRIESGPVAGGGYRLACVVGTAP